MWIEVLSRDEVKDAHRTWELDRITKSSEANLLGYWFTVPPGPLHAIVTWYNSWSPRILHEPLAPEFKAQHLKELRKYPDREDGAFDWSLDVLYGHRSKQD